MATVLWRRVRGGGFWARALSAYVALVLATAVAMPGYAVYAAEGDTTETATPVAEEVVVEQEAVQEQAAVEDPVSADVVVTPEVAAVTDGAVEEAAVSPSADSVVAVESAGVAAPVVHLAAVVPGDSTNLTLSFEGVRKSSGWITGNLQEYGEGEWVPYRVVIENKDAVNSVEVPAVSVTLDHFMPTRTAIMYDGTRGWGYYFTSTAPAIGDTWYPTVTSLVPASQDVPIDPATWGSASLIKTSFASGVITIPAGEYAVLYFQAHLARTPVWNVFDPPRDGAGYVQGSAGHGQLDMPGVGAKTVPLPSVPVPSGAITVYKYFDGNENDNHEALEAMLEGWEFTLRDSNGDVVSTGVTDANGALTFTDLSIGTYTVTETLKGGWDCTGALIREVTVVDRTTSTVWFGNVTQRGDLDVYKYLDDNENDAWDSGEGMLPGWHFDVYDALDDLVGSGVTDANGEFALTDLAPGTYTVVETLQGGWDSTGSLTRIAIVVNNGTAAVWFGNVPDRGDVTVYKFQDDSLNGVHDDGEAMLANWAFDIYDAEDDLVASGVTDENGAFAVTDLAPGTYTAVETPQAGWSNTTPVTQQFVVTDDGTATVWFGNVAQGSLLIHKYLDADEDGIYDEGELMLEDWEFTVTQETPPITPALDAVVLIGTGLTDENGELGFDGLFPGEYVVRETLPEGWHCTSGDIMQVANVPAGGTAELWFGNAPNHGDLAVFKFHDLDEDGLWDEGEDMLSGWEFALYDSEDTLIGTGVTDEYGELTFSDLVPGEYTAVETLAEGWDNTTDLEQTVVVASDEVAELWFGNLETPAPPTPLDLAITKKASVDTADEGELVTYTLTWWNNGETPAENYTIVDDFDERYVTVVDAHGGVVSGGKITWTFAGPLSKEDGKQTMTYTVRISSDMPDVETNVDNVVVISHPDDTDLSNNTDDERVVVEPFLPFTGGDYLLLMGLAFLATVAGVGLRVRAVRSA